MCRLIMMTLFIGLLTWQTTAIAETIDIPVPPGYEPPRGPVYQLIGKRSIAAINEQNLEREWLYGKTILYSSKTPDAVFVVFTDGSVLHSKNNWTGRDANDIGLTMQGGWSALTAIGTGGLVNGLVMDIEDLGYNGFFVGSWIVREATTTVTLDSNKGPFYKFSPKIKFDANQSAEDLAWVTDKEISYLQYRDNDDSLILVFTDGTGILVQGWDTGWYDWDEGVGADWNALVTMGAVAMGTNRRVNVLLEGFEVVSWTLH